MERGRILSMFFCSALKVTRTSCSHSFPQAQLGASFPGSRELCCSKGVKVCFEVLCTCSKSPEKAVSWWLFQGARRGLVAAAGPGCSPFFGRFAAQLQPMCFQVLMQFIGKNTSCLTQGSQVKFSVYEVGAKCPKAAQNVTFFPLLALTGRVNVQLG